MINIKNTYKHICLLIFVLSGGAGTTNASVQHFSKQVVDQAAIQWASRNDVKAAVEELFAVHEKLDEFVQNIFNTYAPHTSGTSHEMRNRIKDLARLVTAAGNVEGIYINYFHTTKATHSHKKNMVSARDNVVFYYFDQEQKHMLAGRPVVALDGHRSFRLSPYKSITREIKSSLESLCKDPEFITHTKLNQVEFDNLVIRIDKAIKAAMATIPGGLAALNAS
jgi:hypothetical protein